ncbi:hypothetical protein DL95DRAFT_469383 [Leptodontidium sp. 2 PMI_412]|nr:hypothetical protein DL95DRAFT_469383 [Leptodontidium sp. 2 PMI_412]
MAAFSQFYLIVFAVLLRPTICFDEARISNLLPLHIALQNGNSTFETDLGKKNNAVFGAELVIGVIHGERIVALVIFLGTVLQAKHAVWLKMAAPLRGINVAQGSNFHVLWGPVVALKAIEIVLLPEQSVAVYGPANPEALTGLRREYQKRTSNEYTWNGGGKAGRQLKRKNRRNAGCGGSSSGGKACVPVFDPIEGVTYPGECGEFPMATTGQGGTGASIKCVPDWQNSLYGIIWSSFLNTQRAKGFKSGDTFRIVLDGCDFTIPPTKMKSKRAASSPILKTNRNLTILSADAFGNATGGTGENAIIIPLAHDAGNPGSYTFNYTLSGGGTIASGFMMDDSGEPLETYTVC